MSDKENAVAPDTRSRIKLRQEFNMSGLGVDHNVATGRSRSVIVGSGSIIEADQGAFVIPVQTNASRGRFRPGDVDVHSVVQYGAD